VFFINKKAENQTYALVVYVGRTSAFEAEKRGSTPLQGTGLAFSKYQFYNTIKISYQLLWISYTGFSLKTQV